MKKNEPSKVVRSETLLFIPLVPSFYFILFFFPNPSPPNSQSKLNALSGSLEGRGGEWKREILNLFERVFVENEKKMLMINIFLIIRVLRKQRKDFRNLSKPSKILIQYIFLVHPYLGDFVLWRKINSLLNSFLSSFLSLKETEILICWSTPFINSVEVYHDGWINDLRSIPNRIRLYQWFLFNFLLKSFALFSFW
jgi:hypothetical protein